MLFSVAHLLKLLNICTYFVANPKFPELAPIVSPRFSFATFSDTHKLFMRFVDEYVYRDMERLRARSTSCELTLTMRWELFGSPVVCG